MEATSQNAIHAGAPARNAIHGRGVENAIQAGLAQAPRHHPTWTEVKAAYGEQLEHLSATCVIEKLSQ